MGGTEGSIWGGEEEGGRGMPVDIIVCLDGKISFK